MPFITVVLPEQHFDSLRAESLSGDHAIVENVGELSVADGKTNSYHAEEDGEMHITPV